MKRLVSLTALVVALAFPSMSQAEMWSCSLPDGTEIFTNKKPESAGNCRVYEMKAELGYISGNAVTMPPLPEAMPTPIVQRPREYERPAESTCGAAYRLIPLNPETPLRHLEPLAYGTGGAIFKSSSR